jgi:hypothetical protein
MAAFLLAVTAPGRAPASSLVFIREGNVWLASPDGATQYPITGAGDYSDPSQADDGTITALEAPGQFVRLDRTGGAVVPPFYGIGSAAGSTMFEGPYRPRISPDAAHIAYSFVSHLESYDPDCDCNVVETREHLTVSRADALTDPNVAGYIHDWRSPSWIGNDRLLVSDGSNVGTWVIGWDYSGFQRWFDDHQHVSALATLELSRDGSKLLVAHGDEAGPTKIILYATNGPAFTADGPPYDEFDPTRPRPTPPVARCEWSRESVVSGLTWAPDGSAFAFGDGAGVWTVPMPATFQSCGELSGGEMVAPGGSQPHWGPADVVQPSGPPPGGGTTTVPPPVTLAACLGATAGVDRTMCVCGLGLAPDACQGSRVPRGVRKAFAAGCAFARKAYGRNAGRMRRRAASAFAKGRRAASQPTVGAKFSPACRRGIFATLAAARP